MNGPVGPPFALEQRRAPRARKHGRVVVAGNIAGIKAVLMASCCMAG